MRGPESAWVVKFAIPFLNGNHLPGDEESLHRLFARALRQSKFPRGISKEGLVFGADADMPFIPELAETVFHLASSGVIHLTDYAGKESYHVSDDAKQYLRTLATEWETKGAITSDLLQASRELADRLNAELSVLGID